MVSSLITPPVCCLIYVLTSFLISTGQPSDLSSRLLSSDYVPLGQLWFLFSGFGLIYLLDSLIPHPHCCLIIYLLTVQSIFWSAFWFILWIAFWFIFWSAGWYNLWTADHSAGPLSDYLLTSFLPSGHSSGLNSVYLLASSVSSAVFSRVIWSIFPQPPFSLLSHLSLYWATHLYTEPPFSLLSHPISVLRQLSSLYVATHLSA